MDTGSARVADAHPPATTRRQQDDALHGNPAARAGGIPLHSGCGGADATAALAPTAGNGAVGTVVFTQKGNKVTVTAKVSELAPGGHGFHVSARVACGVITKS